MHPQEALVSPTCTRVHLTRVFGDFECDTFIPAIDPTIFGRVDRDRDASSELHEENGIAFQFQEFARV